MTVSEHRDEQGADVAGDVGQTDLEAIGVLHLEVAELRVQLEALKNEYELAGASVRTDADADVEFIRELREEAESVLKLVRGATLFGRYADDAELHRRQANRWRNYAVVVLLAAVGLGFYLAVLHPEIALLTAAAPLLPLALLFTYASIESHNHRRTEFDRRRIYLRMAAIEAYTTTDISNDVRNDLGGLLNKFIEKHFIEPELDPNDLSSVSTGWLAPWRARVDVRRGSGQAQREPQPSETTGTPS
ncbi:hypothetical protein ACLQ3B_13585 [Micromonospora sp. DT53]|uniref:hypothetical protein n=1 Tax=Micromonospora sp. DT53 TaxID=3393444 RepID=UPI003CE7AC9E